MSLKNIDLDSALRRLAERRIEDAMKEGKFSNLAGMGKPLDLEPMPADENARMMWWMLRILKQNDFTPEEVRWRKRIDALKEELSQATTELRVRALVKAINGFVRQLNTLGTNALNTVVAPVSLEDALRALHERRAVRPVEPIPPSLGREPELGVRACDNDLCKHANPVEARYCRRCGEPLVA